MPSRLPMLRRRRGASVGGLALRLLERAVGTAERLGSAVRVVERAWSSRHELVALFDDRRVAEVTVVRSPATAETRDDAAPVTKPAPENEPVEPLTWTLARHLATMVERRRLRLELDPWAVGADRVETVRRVRVASRRLRVFIQLFAADLPPKTAGRARRVLRRIGRALGPLRELDAHVQMLDALRIEAGTAEQRVAIEHVLEQLEGRRRPVESRARKKLAKIDWIALRNDLEEITDRVVGPLVRTDVDATAWARHRLWPRLERTFERMPDAEDRDFEALHEIRIAAKRMRYAIEIVGPALGEAEHALRSSLRTVQRGLGAHRDATQLHALLADLKDDLGARGRVALCSALEGRIERIEAARTDAEARIGRILRELHGARMRVVPAPARQPELEEP